MTGTGVFRRRTAHPVPCGVVTRPGQTQQGEDNNGMSTYDTATRAHRARTWLLAAAVAVITAMGVVITATTGTTGASDVPAATPTVTGTGGEAGTSLPTTTPTAPTVSEVPAAPGEVMFTAATPSLTTPRPAPQPPAPPVPDQPDQPLPHDCQVLAALPAYQYDEQGAEVSVPDGAVRLAEMRADGLSGTELEAGCAAQVAEQHSHTTPPPAPQNPGTGHQPDNQNGGQNDNPDDNQDDVPGDVPGDCPAGQVPGDTGTCAEPVCPDGLTPAEDGTCPPPAHEEPPHIPVTVPAPGLLTR